MDHKTAGMMLYALQTASCNLRNTQFEAEDATHVVIDRGSVDRTCMGGPQWFKEDFEGEDEVETDDEAEDGEVLEDEVLDDEEEAVEEVPQVAAESGAEAGSQRPVEHISNEEARRRVQRVVVDWVAETVKAAAAGSPE
jgi:hypothetical protein